MSSLLEETLRLARNSKSSSSQICEAAKVKQRWFYDLLEGRYEDPGIKKIERLNKALKALDSGTACKKSS